MGEGETRAPSSRRRGGQWAQVHMCANWRGEGESRKWMSVWHLLYAGARRHRHRVWRDRGCSEGETRVWYHRHVEGQGKAPLSLCVEGRMR